MKIKIKIKIKNKSTEFLFWQKKKEEKN